MKVHTDKITQDQLRDIALEAFGTGSEAFVKSAVERGSRSRARAFDVTIAAGHESPRSATWIEWGDWIVEFFKRDPDAIVGHYKGDHDFVIQTQAAADRRPPLERVDAQNAADRWSEEIYWAREARENNPPLQALRHNVTGAVERGEAEAITERVVDPALAQIDPVLRTEEEMDHHPPFGDNLVTGDIEWLRTHEHYGIRVDLYDVHRDGKRNLPLFGYRLSHHNEREKPRLMQEGEARREEGWEILFTGEDYEPGPGHDQDMILADLLGFLSSYDELTDTDITPRQLIWLGYYRDELATWSAELEGELDDGRD